MKHLPAYIGAILLVYIYGFIILGVDLTIYSLLAATVIALLGAIFGTTRNLWLVLGISISLLLISILPVVP